MRKLTIIIWGVFILPMQLFSQINKTLELHCICKAWGFLKYYHPSIQRGKINWDNYLLESLEEYDKGTSYNIIIEKSNNFKDVYVSLAELHTNINDGHGFYHGPYYNKQKKGETVVKQIN